tara:strand:- start:1221 stop:1772 length:552 start_codon:yes stop_codon:yes gene_type:complete
LKILNDFINTRYEDIMLMSKKICRSHHEWEEVGHYSIDKFTQHERAEELIESNRAMNFLSGIIHRSFHSSTSQYHTEIRQKGRVHSFTSENHLKQSDINYNEEEDSLIESTSAAINVILEEMVADKGRLWLRAVLFQMWIETPNFTELSKITRIPRTSISHAVEEAREHIKQELKNRGINYEH